MTISQLICGVVEKDSLVLDGGRPLYPKVTTDHNPYTDFTPIVYHVMIEEL